MALDATVAGASADSYLTVAQADAIAAGQPADDPEAAKWQEASTTTDMKEDALRQATYQVDALLGSGWARFSATQALRFPRTVDYTTSGGVSTPHVLEDIKRGVAAQARYVLYNARQLAAARSAFARGEPLKVDMLSPLARVFLKRWLIDERSGGVGTVRMSAGAIGEGYGL